MRILSVICSLAPILLAAAADVQLPPELHVNPGRLLRIPATTTGPAVKWQLCQVDQADLIPLSGDGKLALFTAATPGVYRVFAWTGDATGPSDAAVCLVTVGNPSPPAPTPTPIPPTPTPGPANPFSAALQAAWTSETSPTRDQERANLASFYRWAATASSNPTNTTWGNLTDAMGQLATATAIRGKLLYTQKAIQPLLVSILPTDPSKTLDQAGRDLARKTFLQVADALDRVQGRK